MPRVGSGRLTQFATAIFESLGTPADIADEVAKSLVSADLSGHPSHGVIRIVGEYGYVNFVRNGMVEPAGRPEAIQRDGATAMVDGNWGFGHTAAAFATRLAAELARKHGISMVGVYRSNHMGRLGLWAEMAAEEGIILLMSLGGSGWFGGTPYGGAARALATNPFAAAVPAGERDPMIVDFATMSSAEGKVRVALTTGKRLPEGQILDKDGNPSTDPADLYEGGMLLPFGGHKGSALAILMEALGSCLTGAESTEKMSKEGAILIGIDPARFRDRPSYDEAATGLFERIEAVPPAPGFEEVMLPGEPERRARARGAASGVEIAPEIFEALRDIALELDVAPDLLSER